MYSIKEKFFPFPKKVFKLHYISFAIYTFVCSILRIYERGVLDKIQERMLPTMPRCASSAAFNSARLADVYSAFFLLVAGMVIAISLGIFERIWNKRKQMRETVVRGIRKHNLIPHLHFHHDSHRHDRLDARHPHLRVVSIGKSRGYDPAYLTMLQNHARQVQSFVGFQERDVSPKKPRGPGLEPRLQVRQRSTGPKGATWSSFSSLPKSKLRLTEKILSTSNAENTRVFPFRD